MSERYWQRPALATTALALLGAATVGCGNSASTSAATATQTAGVAATTGPKSFTAAQLKRALLIKVGGARPAAPAEAGAYGTLPDVRTSKQTMHGVKVTPAKCAQATVTGKTFRYSVKETAFSGLANQARALNVKAAGYAVVDVWSVVYRGDGFVGAVTIVGPDASAAGAKNLARQAYAYAAQSLTRRR